GCIVIWNIHAHDRQVGRWIVADGVSRKAPPVGKRDLNSRGLVDHVAIGENQAVGSEHETGTATLVLAGLTRSAFARLRNINLDYGWAELLGGAHDRLRVGIEQSGIIHRASVRSLDRRFGIIRN